MLELDYKNMENIPKLVFVNSDSSFEEFLLIEPETFIGRNPKNQIVLNDSSVSRVHAKVTRFNNEFKIFDLNSANGVKINNLPATESSFKSGDFISIGDIKLFFIDPENPVKIPEITDSLVKTAIRKPKKSKVIVTVIAVLLLLIAVLLMLLLL